MAKNKVMTDSVLLALMKMLTMPISIISAMILSRVLPLNEYGSFSTGNLVISSATSLSALGLVDAVNYFYNIKSEATRNKYIDTVFGLVCAIGTVTAVLLFVFRSGIYQYFHNPSLHIIFAYIIFRPMISNLSLCFQYMQVSIGKAKKVAIRNLIVMIAKLLSVIATALFTQSITTVFICVLIVEALGLCYYYVGLRSDGITIRIWKIDKTLIKEILLYCIPMGIYIQFNSLSRDLDKYVIGFFESTEQLAVYTNCSTRLPFDIVSSSLLIVLVPILTRCIRVEHYEDAVQLFKANIRIGFTITFSICAVVIALSPYAVNFLYGEKYLSGLPIFILYVVVDLLYFISFSIVLAAKGKTRFLMKVSCASLAGNAILNILLYNVLGFIGPAIATVIVTAVINGILLYQSAIELKTSFLHLFELKHILRVSTETLGVSLLIWWLSTILSAWNIHPYVILIVLGAMGVGLLLLINLKDIIGTFRKVSQISNEMPQ